MGGRDRTSSLCMPWLEMLAKGDPFFVSVLALVLRGENWLWVWLELVLVHLEFCCSFVLLFWFALGYIGVLVWFGLGFCFLSFFCGVNQTQGLTTHTRQLLYYWAIHPWAKNASGFYRKGHMCCFDLTVSWVGPWKSADARNPQFSDPWILYSILNQPSCVAVRTTAVPILFSGTG